ncbi:MAG: hypothetical protein MUO53_08380 [Maribacter sp.]|nr:hypothetical protein [Maribacter sp.]
MNILEINATGNFETWNPSTIKEVKDENLSTDLGHDLLYENENVRIWEVVLLPNERLPFREIKFDYSWVALTSGLAISRYADGKINLMRFEKGDSAFMKYVENSAICDLENKGGDILFFHMTEFKQQTFKKYLTHAFSLKSNNPYIE